MGVLDLLISDDVTVGTTSSSAYETAIYRSDSGSQLRVSRWAEQTAPALGGLPTGPSHGRFSLRFQDMDEEQEAEIRDHFWATRGAHYGFRFRDWADWSTHPSGTETPNWLDPSHRVTIGVTDNATTVFQLQKFYNNPGGGGWLRKITKPMRLSDTDYYLRVSVLGVDLTQDIIPDFDTGEIRFVGGLGLTVATQFPGIAVEAAFTFHVPVTFGPETERGLVSRWEEHGVQVDSMDLVEISPDEHYGDGQRLHGGWSTVDFGSVGSGVTFAPDWFALGMCWRVQNVQAGARLGLPTVLGATVGAPLVPGGGPWVRIWNDSTQSLRCVDTASGAAIVDMAPGHTAEFWRSAFANGGATDLFWESR